MENEKTSRNETELLEIMRRLLRPLEPKPTGVLPRTAPLPGIRAVLFDVYGTLLVSGSGDVGTTLAGSAPAAALRAAFEDENLRGDLRRAGERGAVVLKERIEAAHAARRSGGCAFPEVEIRTIWKEVLRDLHAEGLLSDLPPENSVPRLAVAYECRANPTWPMPGFSEVLEKLVACAYPLGIVSNAQFYTPLLLRFFLGKSLEEAGFADSLCAWSYREFEAKPSPSLFRPPLTALKNDYGIAPEETLYVGNDMLNDILPASSLGMRTVLFAGDERSYRRREDDERTAKVKPDRVITALGDLLLILDADV